MVFRMVLNQAAVLLAVGMGLGIAAMLGSGSMLHAYLYGTGARNPIVLVGVCGLVAATGLVAAYLPARRAMQTDPAVAPEKRMSAERGFQRSRPERSTDSATDSRLAGRGRRTLASGPVMHSRPR